MNSNPLVIGMADPPAYAASLAGISPVWRAVKAIAWCVMVLLALYYIRRSVGRYLDVQPDTYAYFWSKRYWLWLHIGGALFTLLLGPLQFVGRLRAAYPKLHRWSGRIYLVGLLLAGIGATGLFATTPLGWTTGVAFAVMVLAWLTTGVVALLAILKRDIAVHRAWMVRNYIITFAFVTFRLVGRIPGVNELGTVQESFTTFVWMSWVVPLLVWEAFSQVRRLNATQRGGAIRSS